MKRKFEHLFSPILINQTMLKNRIIATPVGDPNQPAMGGAGMVITHSYSLDIRNAFWNDDAYPFSKYRVAQTRKELLMVHAGGAKCSYELLHTGFVARVGKGEFAMGPCDGINDDGCFVRAMDQEQMDNVCVAYAKAAKDAKDLGFDLVFMHFGHGWLPAQFLSPLYNHREDEYGGDIQHRAKFPLAILKAVRQSVGPDFPIDMRISAVEHVPGSIRFEDTLAFIKMAEVYIDSVQISCGLDMGFQYHGNTTMATTIFEPHQINVEYASKVKQEVKIPVAAVGAIMSPKEAEALIASGKLDLVAIGRSMVADPLFSNKALQGRAEDIKPCLRCLQCYHIASNHRNIGCSVNPCYKNDDYLPEEENIKKNEKKRKVVVVGGGPAGLKAALTAEKRGNQVMLLEQGQELGGMLKYIAKEAYKEDIAAYLSYLKIQIAKSSIEVKLNTKAKKEDIRKLQPDDLILALGAEAIKLGMKGEKKPFVYSIVSAMEHHDQLGQSIVIIGGGTIGAEMGLALGEKEHKDVTIIEATDQLASKGNVLYRISLLQHLENCAQIHPLMNASCQEIKEQSVVVKTKDGIQEIPCNSVIIAVGMKAKKAEAHALFGITPNTVMIGDCLRVRSIMEATFEGYVSGLNTK